MQIKFIPGVHPSYRSQFDKLTEAYINGSVDPMSTCACFVGNLLNREARWSDIRNDEALFTTGLSLRNAKNHLFKQGVDVIDKESKGLYTPEDIFYLEDCFLRTIILNGGKASLAVCRDVPETALFIAFEKTLDLLKTIHESKGEVIDEVPTFKKRSAVTA